MPSVGLKSAMAEIKERDQLQFVGGRGYLCVIEEKTLIFNSVYKINSIVTQCVTQSICNTHGSTMFRGKIIMAKAQ